MGEFTAKRTRPEVFGLKPYVPGKPIEEVQRELGLTDIVKLASNENPLGPSPKAIQAIQENLQKLHLYPDANCFYLKEQISKKIAVEMNQIIVGNGSDEILMMIAQTFLERGDEVIVGNPTFAEYEFTAQIMGAKMISVPLDATLTHDLEAIAAAITEKTKLIYLCNPNNPTGTVVDQAKLKWFVNQIPEHILLIFDEAYYEYIDIPDYPSGLNFLNSGKNILVTRTFSKMYGLAALRIGYAVTSSEIAGTIEKVKEPFNVNMLAQLAATAAINDLNHIEQSKTMNTKGRQFLYQELSAMGVTYISSQANFMFIKTGKDSKGIFEDLMKMGIIIRPGYIFGYPEYIRMTIGTQPQNERFIAALKSIL